MNCRIVISTIENFHIEQIYFRGKRVGFLYNQSQSIYQGWQRIKLLFSRANLLCDTSSHRLGIL